jgi:hypothetical protein
MSAQHPKPEMVTSRPGPSGPEIHPAWHALIEYCRRLQHGDIERLRIQDGLPVLAEVITRKIKFNSADPLDRRER